MYSKQEAALLKEEFWTSLGKYLAPIPSANNERINWINYKTAVKTIRFKMSVDKAQAFMIVEMNPDEDIQKQELMLNQFKRLKEQLNEAGAAKWNFDHVDNKGTVRIYQSLSDINIFNKEDWPGLISFFKTGIILFDRCWNENREIFQMLE